MRGCASHDEKHLCGSVFAPRCCSMGSCCRAGMSSSLYLLVAAAIVACTGCGVHGAAGDVKFVALVHRHGDRSPVRFLPTDATNNAHWVDGPGQLTPIGIHQLHTLGASLRQRYLIDRGVVPETYSRRFVHVRSTDVDRTLMSAESLLEGLFPPGTGPDTHDGSPALTTADLQPVPIHTVPNDNDPLLRGCVSKGGTVLRWTLACCSLVWRVLGMVHQLLGRVVSDVSRAVQSAEGVASMASHGGSACRFH